MNDQAIHGFISGRVQGVGFRMATAQQANLLGINGWVRNCQDGRVEFYASGNTAQVNDFKQWLTKGPAMAEVNSLDVENVALESVDSFEILRTV